MTFGPNPAPMKCPVCGAARPVQGKDRCPICGAKHDAAGSPGAALVDAMTGVLDDLKGQRPPGTRRGAGHR
jgi:hypothetical protein